MCWQLLPEVTCCSFLLKDFYRAQYLLSEDERKLKLCLRRRHIWWGFFVFDISFFFFFFFSEKGIELTCSIQSLNSIFKSKTWTQIADIMFFLMYPSRQKVLFDTVSLMLLLPRFGFSGCCWDCSVLNSGCPPCGWMFSFISLVWCLTSCLAHSLCLSSVYWTTNRTYSPGTIHCTRSRNSTSHTLRYQLSVGKR